MTEYSFVQKFLISFWGRIKVGERELPDFTDGPMMFYAFNCPIHGIVENYPASYNGRLLCPKCINSKHEQ